MPNKRDDKLVTVTRQGKTYKVPVKYIESNVTKQYSELQRRRDDLLKSRGLPTQMEFEPMDVGKNMTFEPMDVSSGVETLNRRDKLLKSRYEDPQKELLARRDKMLAQRYAPPSDDEYYDAVDEHQRTLAARRMTRAQMQGEPRETALQYTSTEPEFAGESMQRYTPPEQYGPSPAEARQHMVRQARVMQALKAYDMDLYNENILQGINEAVQASRKPR